MKTRRQLASRGVGILSAGLGAVILGACGSVGSTATLPEGVPSQKGPVSLRLATDWLSGVRGDTLRAALATFEQQFPTIKVEVEAITGDYWTAINTQLAAGTIQEVVLFEGNFFQSFKDQNAFTPIDPVLKQHRISMADYSVVPGIYQDKGKQYGMPFQLVASGWLYNVDLFEERGLKPPTEGWTWNDVLTAAQGLTQPERQQYGILVQSDAQFCWGPLLFSAGARWHNVEGTRTLLTDQGGLEAFQWVIDLIYRYRVSPTPAEAKEVRGNSPNAFVAGKVAMLPTGLQSIGNTVRQVGNRFRWALMPTPKHPKTHKATHVWNDQPHIVTTTAARKKVVEEATQLVVFLAGEAAQARIAVDRGSIPVLKRLQTGPDYLKPPPDNMRQVAMNLSDPDIQTPGFIKGWDEWWKAINDEVSKAFDGQVPAQQALRNAVTAGDAVLSRYGPQR